MTEPFWGIDSGGRRRRICDAIRSTAERPNDERGFACANYAVRALEDGTWVCGIHDPQRKVCERAAAHSNNPPRSIATLDGVRLCGPCYEASFPKAKPAKKAREVMPPCCLCHGSTALEDNAGRLFPCPCTPFGRELINGEKDAVVLARLEGRAA